MLAAVKFFAKDTCCRSSRMSCCCFSPLRFDSGRILLFVVFARLLELEWYDTGALCLLQGGRVLDKFEAGTFTR